MKTKKMKTKMNQMGGMKLLAQGTHGKIYEVGDKVMKQFQNRTKCDEMGYEFEMQQDIHGLLERRSMIKVPESSHFKVEGDMCQYMMDRIYPVDKHLWFVDMTFPRGERSGQTTTSKQLGYMDAAREVGVTPNELAMIIGELFSALHFVLQVDGYDCELIIGKGGLYWIDFDKVTKFDFSTTQTLRRKVAEDLYEEKVITSTAKLARFLFTSFISMSLLPVEPLMKSYFLMGYKKYARPELIPDITAMIDDYSA